MQLGAVTYNVLKDWDLDQIIRTLGELGYEAVELRTGHKHGVEPSLNAAERAAVQAKFGASRVRLLELRHHLRVRVARSASARPQRRNREAVHRTRARYRRPRHQGSPQRPARRTCPRRPPFATSARACTKSATAGLKKGIEIWMEVHGRDTQNPPVAAAIMRATAHRNVGLCWNSNPTDVVNGSIRPSFDLLRPWIRNCHINELTSAYPWRELFTLLRKSNYDRYTLCEVAESKEPERFLRYYKACGRS